MLVDGLGPCRLCPGRYTYGYEDCQLCDRCYEDIYMIWGRTYSKYFSNEDFSVVGSMTCFMWSYLV